MNILALDLATRTGWAMWDGIRIESGVQVFDVKRGESPGMRYVRFNKWLNEIHGHLTCGCLYNALVVFEQAHHRGGAATEVAAGFTTRVLEFCAVHGLEHSSVHTQTLKKFATGSGGRGIKKEAMIAACNAKLGTNITDNNEADARWILEYAIKEIVPAGGKGKGR